MCQTWSNWTLNLNMYIFVLEMISSFQEVGLLPFNYSKACVKWLLSKRPKIDFKDQLLLNTGQKYCRMLQGEHSAILSTFIKLPCVIKIVFCQFLSGRFTQVLHRTYLFVLISLT